MKGRNGPTWEHLWLTRTVCCMDALSISPKQMGDKYEQSIEVSWNWWNCACTTAVRNWATSRHLCCIFASCLARGCVPTACKQVKVMFTLNPGRLTILRLRHIILLIYCQSCWWCYKKWWAGISGTRNWDLSPYTETSLPTNQVKSTETALHSVVTHTGCSETRGNSSQEFFYTVKGTLTDPYLKL